MDNEPVITFGTGLETIHNEDGTFTTRRQGNITRLRSFLMGGHMHVRGRTRSGKTSLAIRPLIRQILQEYEGEDGYMHQDPILVFDLGGDQALFHDVRHHTRQHRGKGEKDKFRFLSLQEDDDWDFFDPFQTLGSNQSIIRLCNMLVEAFHLDYGLIYGGTYFTQQNLAALLAVARHLVANSETRPTLRDVQRYLDSKTGRKYRDADQIKMTFQFLLEYPQLGRPDPIQDPRPNGTIDMERVLENGEVVYFFLPTLNEAMTSRQIAGLGLYSAIHAASNRSRQGKNVGRNRRHLWIIVDEFQELAGRSFAALLAQAAKFNISLVMANQTTTQLSNRDMPLKDIVADNTIVKMYFTVTNQDDVDDLQALSADEVSQQESRTIAFLDSRLTERDILMPKLKRNVILETSATRNQAFLIIDDGKGHAEPMRIEIAHSQDESEYLRRKSEPLRRGKRVSTDVPGVGADYPVPWREGRKHHQTLDTNVQTQLDELLQKLVVEEGEADGTLGG